MVKRWCQGGLLLFSFSFFFFSIFFFFFFYSFSFFFSCHLQILKQAFCLEIRVDQNQFSGCVISLFIISLFIILNSMCCLHYRNLYGPFQIILLSEIFRVHITSFLFDFLKSTSLSSSNNKYFNSSKNSPNLLLFLMHAILAVGVMSAKKL